MPSHMLVSEAIDEWLTEKGRKLAPNSLRQYTLQIGYFRDALDEDTTFADLDRSLLLDFLDDRAHWADGEEKAGATIRMTMVILQQFLEWSVELDYLAVLPLKRRDLQKPPIGQRTTLPTEAQVNAIRQAAQDRPDWLIVYECLRLTGCRPSELANANIADIDHSQPQPELILRKHKTVRKVGARRIPLTDLVWPLFESAIGNRVAGPVFTTPSGGRWTVQRLSTLFRTYRDACGLPSEIVLYCTRHEFGTTVAQNSGIDAAKALLGHRNITTTQRYSHPPMTHLADVQRRAGQALKPQLDHGQTSDETDRAKDSPEDTTRDDPGP